jgi:hypothetical protein
MRLGKRITKIQNSIRDMGVYAPTTEKEHFLNFKKFGPKI